MKTLWQLKVVVYHDDDDEPALIERALVSTLLGTTLRTRLHVPAGVLDDVYDVESLGGEE